MTTGNPHYSVANYPQSALNCDAEYLFSAARGDTDFYDGELFMKLMLVAAVSAFVAIPALAQAQQGGPPPSSAPKPTKADVQKVVQIISSDKAKTQVYCDLDKLYDQMQTADQNNDSKTVEALGKQADAMTNKLGPEYAKMMDGLDQVDPNSSEGKELVSILSGLDKLCGK